MSVFFFFKQKTAYEMRISDWSSDVCSSDLDAGVGDNHVERLPGSIQRVGAGAHTLERCQVKLNQLNPSAICGLLHDRLCRLRRLFQISRCADDERTTSGQHPSCLDS